MSNRRAKESIESLLDEVEQLIESVRVRRGDARTPKSNARGHVIVDDRNGRFTGWLAGGASPPDPDALEADGD